jgi:predicted glycoside hydrolase/deacetylase ChbG (UPF0249 family)
MPASRLLCVIADDYGIGPETSRCILDLAGAGAVSGTVLLVNSPHAAAGVRAWRQAGEPVELGWHPCLTMDAPVLPPGRVPSLVGPDGRFWPLGRFLARLLLGLVRTREVENELLAQYSRFLALVGRPPTLVNAHHHVAVFRPVGGALRRVLARQRPLPYLRRVREPLVTLARAPGARLKRAVLAALGQDEARRQVRAGFPGADWLGGITDPRCVADVGFFVRWLTRVPGQAVELACHPGYHDPAVVGRDGDRADSPLLRRRVNEWRLLSGPSFAQAVQRAGFTLVPPSAVPARPTRGTRHAA